VILRIELHACRANVMIFFFRFAIFFFFLFFSHLRQVSELSHVWSEKDDGMHTFSDDLLAMLEYFDVCFVIGCDWL
jgi:hypothetical protein